MSSPLSPSPAPWWQTLRLRDVALGTLVVMLVVLVCALLVNVRNVLISIFLGLLLATALRPLMSRLQAGHLPRFVAASASILTLLALVAGFLVLVVPLAITQIDTLLRTVPRFYNDLRLQLIGSSIRIVRQVGLQLQLSLPDDPDVLANALVEQLVVQLPLVGYGIFVTLSTLFFTYYWLLYRERSLRGMLLLLPMERRERVEQVWQRIEERIGAFIRGQVILALVTAGVSLVGYWLIGLPYALLLALVAGVLEFVPFLGPFLGGAIATAVGFSVSSSLGISALILSIAIQQIENIFLAPRIMDKAVGISPVVTLLAFVGFTALFGPAGGLLAIPLAATCQVLFVAWLESRSPLKEEPTPGRSRADRLIYQARDLAQDITRHMRQKDDATPVQSDRSDEALEQVVNDLTKLLGRENGQEPVDAR